MANIKDLFGSHKSQKTLVSKSLNDLGSNIESANWIKSTVKEHQEFEPRVDYTTASNFARYGSAEQYYKDAFSYIQNEYPYDGSGKEKTDWEIGASGIDKYIFNNEYPRTTGYVTIGKDATATTSKGGYWNPSRTEYIYFEGGPHPAPQVQAGEKVSKFFPTSQRTTPSANYYNATANQQSNLEIDGDRGISVEFWLKKTGYTSGSESERQVICDVWNNGLWGTSLGVSSSYGRFRLEISGTGAGIAPKFYVEFLSGTAGFTSGHISSSSPMIQMSASSLTGSSWNHFALTFKNTGSQMAGRLYQNGNLLQTLITGSSIGLITGSMIGQIGSLITAVSGNQASRGYALLSASLDEFRFWKIKRTSEQIGQNWFTQINGGTNTDWTKDYNAPTKYSYTNPVDLGVYYKFNEGIINSSSANSNDTKILDYSGRISNGTWTGYTVGARSTGSAIVESSAASSEFKDPILYSHHRDVSSKLDELKLKGFNHDINNNAAIFQSVPGWIRDEDIVNDGNTLLKLTQIIASYFDTLQLQIQNLPRLRDTEYVSSSYKPLPFTSRLIDSTGLDSAELFADANVLEALASRDDFRSFSEKLNETKNKIYQNLYNNLVYIFKSKGTAKSIRNLIRCYGVGDELVKLNLYADQTTSDIKENYESSITRKRYANFYTTGSFSATVYQSSSTTDTNVKSFLTSSANAIYQGNTFETEIIFPKKVGEDSPISFATPFTVSSLFGVHTVAKEPAEPPIQWAPYDVANFQVTAVRGGITDNDAYFKLSSTTDGIFPTLTSSIQKDVYESSRWNIAVRVKPISYPWADAVNSSGNRTYDVEFSGYQVLLDSIENQFKVTGSVSLASGQSFLSSSKRIFVGAHRTNFTGAVLQKSDVKISSARYWNDYLEDEVILAHARDPSNFGRLHPGRNTFLNQKGDDFADNIMQVPQMETLAVHWNFDTVTGSDASGEFVVEDYSSGSANAGAPYGWFGEIKYRHPGKGTGFPTSNTDVTVREYVYTAKQQPPEVIGSDDMIDIKTESDVEISIRDTRPVRFFFAVEKSLYASVSAEMIKFFATVLDFNNLIGEPVNRYRQNYKALEKVRQLFFEKVQNDTVDFEKFVDYYKWIDESIGKMVVQLFPVTANFSRKVFTMIESHVLERNKYWNKFPTLEIKPSDPEAGLRGINEMLYPWKYGGAPIQRQASASFANLLTLAGFSDNDRFTVNVPTTVGGTGVDITVKMVAGTPSAGTANQVEVSTAGTSAAILARLVIAIAGGTPSPSNSVAYGTGAGDATNGIAGITAALGTNPTITVTATRDGLRGNDIVFTDVVGTMVAGGGAGSSPANLAGGLGNANVNCLWWNERAKRSSVLITSGDSIIDGQRDKFRLVNDFRSGSGPNLAISRDSTSTTTTYKGQAYALRNFTKPYRLAVDESPEIHGGSNFPRAKTVEYTHEALEFGSTEQLEIAASSIAYEKVCNDVIVPNIKNRLEYKLRDTRDLQGYTSGKGTIFAPFSLFSSSVGTGYMSDVSTNFKANTDITNYHDDVYGDDKGIPLQGPFTERHVGGRQHRHIDINSASTDTILTRPEAWNFGMAGSALALSYPSASTENADETYAQPRATMLRDETAKRPLNIRNIKWGTSSAVAGNYRKDYEAVQTSGRSLNNRFFVDNEGFSPSVNASPYVSGVIDFVLPRYDLTGTNKHIFVERFSAPGGPEVNSRGALDVYAEEYSVYNELNNRNLIVRNALKSWQTEHCGQFGIDPTGTIGDGTIPAEHIVNALSYDGVVAAYHKVNRNPRKMAALTNGFEGAATCSINYDNWFIQHPIPQSDYQYSWITASVSKSACDTFGHYGSGDGGRTNFSIPTGSTGSVTVSAIPFITASNINAGGNYADFVGLNTLIYDPLTSSLNILSASDGNYINTLIASITSPKDLNSLLLHRNGPYQYPSWKQIRTGENPLARHQRRNNIITVDKQSGVEILNRQFANTTITTRYTEPVVGFKYKPLQTTLTNVDPTLSDQMNQEVIFRHSYGNNLEFFANETLTIDFGLPSGRGIQPAYMDPTQPNVQMHDLLSAQYTNDPSMFGSLEYSEVVYPKGVNTGLKKNRGRTQYAETVNTITNADGTISASLSNGSNGIDRGPIDRRTFWRNSAADRNRKNSYAIAVGVGASNNAFQTTIFNSCGRQDGYARSVWCFGEEPLVFDPPLSVSPQRYGISLSASQTTPGYVNLNDGSDLGELNSVNINRLGSFMGGVISSSVANYYTGYLYNNPTASAMYYSLPHQGQNQDHLANLFRGNGGLDGAYAAYADLAAYPPGTYTVELCKGMKWRTAIDAGKNPWFDSYEEYADDIRGLAKSWTVLPEFRISDHLPYYVKTRGGNFRARNDKFLSLNGANITSSADTETTIGPSRTELSNPGAPIPEGVNFLDNDPTNFNDNFFTEYSFSDFQKYFGKFTQDHDLSEITLTCNAVKKLLPYKGFYPADRTTQLVSLFSGALGQYVGGGALSGTNPPVPNQNSVNVSDECSSQLALQSLLQPWFAPGILYNTIKSGIAVDWPVFTGSIGMGAFGINTETEKWFYDTVGTTFGGNPVARPLSADTRFPFKSLLDPLDSMPFSQSNGSHRLIYMAPSYNLMHYELDVGEWDSYKPKIMRQPYAEFTSPRPPKSVLNLYSSAMHNFLAEIPNFFLKGKSLSSIESLPQSSIHIEKDKVYAMDVYIEKTNTPTNELVMLEDYYNGSVSGTAIRNTFGSDDTFDTINEYAYVLKSPITASWNGKYFGPPWDVNSGSQTNWLNIKFGASAWQSGFHPGAGGDPAYAPHTPPYFYGKAKVRLIYTGSAEDEQTEGAGGGPNFRKILNNVSMSFKSTTDERRDMWNRYGLWKWSQSPAGGAPNSLSSSAAYVNMMDVTASLDILGLKIDQKRPTDPGFDRWTIAPFMETPVLDFSSSQVPERGYGRGMWSGYGEIPRNNKGIYFGLETAADLFVSAPNKSDIRDMRDWFPALAAAPTEVQESSFEEEAFGSLPLAPTIPEGANAQRKNVGEIAGAKTISEAIVAIPFCLNRSVGGGASTFAKTIRTPIMNKYFFALGKNKAKSRRIFNETLKNINNTGLAIPGPNTVTDPKLRWLFDYYNTELGGVAGEYKLGEISDTSISRMARLMDTFILPPQLDFKKDANIEPFAMYILGFDVELDQQDLADIWQGVMPKISTTAKLDVSSFSHPIKIWEFFGGEAIPEDVRWMVFKVKKRAHINYWSTTPSSTDDPGFRPGGTKTGGIEVDRVAPGIQNFVNPVGLPYSYNWPYDYFSLVELAHIGIKNKLK